VKSLVMSFCSMKTPKDATHQLLLLDAPEVL